MDMFLLLFVVVSGVNERVDSALRGQERLLRDLFVKDLMSI